MRRLTPGGVKILQRIKDRDGVRPLDSGILLEDLLRDIELQLCTGCDGPAPRCKAKRP